MTVARILGQKGSSVIAVGPAETLQSIVNTLARHQVGVVVVVDADQKLVGIISERDVIGALAGDAAAALRLVAADIMTEQVATCAPDDGEGEVMERMSARGVRHLPVVAAGKLAGVVSLRDIIKLRLEKIDEMMRAIEREAADMKEGVSKAW